MNWDAIGAIGEIVGAVAVVATLGYLAAQTRLSNRLARANTILQLQAENRAHRNALSHDEDLARIVMKAIAGEELTNLELFRYRARSDSSLSFFESIFLQAEVGTITREDFVRFEPVIRGVAKVAKERGLERAVQSPQFTKYIDALLEDPEE